MLPPPPLVAVTVTTSPTATAPRAPVTSASPKAMMTTGPPDDDDARALLVETPWPSRSFRVCSRELIATTTPVTFRDRTTCVFASALVDVPASAARQIRNVTER